MSGKLKLVIYAVLLLVMPITYVFAQSDKDADFDGVFDDVEITKYHTDPQKYDTDGDGISDSVEIVQGTDPTNSEVSPVTASKASATNLASLSGSLPWLIARISGVVSFILLNLVVVFGLIQSSRSLVKYRVMSVITARETHRAIAWAGLACVVLHFGSLFFDTTIELKLYEALIPMQVTRGFKSALGFDFKIPVSMGVVAFYLMAVLITTSELRAKIVSMKVWRTIHYASFLAYILFLVHGFTTGSDSKEWWMRAIYVGSFVSVFGLLLARIFRAKLFYARPVVKSPVVTSSVAQNSSV